jgi:hypothetical protein
MKGWQKIKTEVGILPARRRGGKSEPTAADIEGANIRTQHSTETLGDAAARAAILRAGPERLNGDGPALVP